MSEMGFLTTVGAIKSNLGVTKTDHHQSIVWVIDFQPQDFSGIEISRPHFDDMYYIYFSYIGIIPNYLHRILRACCTCMRCCVRIAFSSSFSIHGTATRGNNGPGRRLDRRSLLVPRVCPSKQQRGCPSFIPLQQSFVNCNNTMSATSATARRVVRNLAHRKIDW